jgi:exopolyphosphatase/guanosine-5'-triphosphate,3'-diphosphate pyrophosphatase
VIRNSELAGLTDTEIEVIAQIARYHRKSEPKPSHPEFAGLSTEDQQLVRTLAGILRVAIGLDRSHRADVRGIDVEIEDDRVILLVDAEPGASIDLELYAANERRGLLESVIDREVVLKAR